MSQFRKIASAGQLYFSQWDGDNANAGTDPTLPKRDLSYWTTGNLTGLLGSGWYFYETANRSANAWFEGDGKTVVDFRALPTFNTNLSSFSFRLAHVIAINFPLSNLPAFSNCVFIYTSPGMAFTFRANGDVYSENLFTNRALVKIAVYGNVRLTGGFTGSARNSIFDIDPASPTPDWTTSNSSSFPWDRNYFSKNTLFRINNILQLASITNNLLNGPIITPQIDSVLREAKFKRDGSPRNDVNPSFPDIADVFPNFYLQGNFGCDDSEVGFIDPVSKIVTPESHLLKIQPNGFGFIGGVKVGRKIDLNESGFTITKTGIDDSNPNFWKIATGVNFAKIRITGKVSDSLISAQTLDIRIPFNFDGDALGNTATNNNVPDAWNSRTTPDTKGTKPNRLTFEVRSSQLTNPGRDVSADWDNDSTNNPSIAGRYYLMEYGQPMLHHIISGVAYGNADANAINAAVKMPFNYRSLDIIITITNTREI